MKMMRIYPNTNSLFSLESKLMLHLKVRTTAPPDRDGAIGACFEIDGIETVVLGVEAYDQSSLGFPRLRVLVRTENMSGRASDNPEVELRPADEPSAPSDWYAGTSWQPGGAIGAAEVRQGEVIVGFPHKPRSRPGSTRLRTCTSPILRFTPGGPAVLGTTEASKGASAGRASTTDRSAVAVPVDPSLITAAINRPRVLTVYEQVGG